MSREDNICGCGAYGGGQHTKSARCDGSPEPEPTRTLSSKDWGIDRCLSFLRSFGGAHEDWIIEIEALQRNLDLRNEQIDGYERQLGIDNAGVEHTIGSEIERLQSAHSEHIKEIEAITQQRDDYKADYLRVHKAWVDLKHPDTVTHPETTACHFRAFGTMPCALPRGHEGPHSCRDGKAPQAPIAKLTVWENGIQVTVSMYAPGLPPGEHDVYLDPAAPGIPGNALNGAER